MASSSLHKPAATNASGTLLSRLTGFVRDIALANTLGAGPLADIFVVAFRFPNLFRRAFAEGAFNAAFLPLLAQKMRQSKAQAQSFAAHILWLLLGTLFVLCVGAVAGMDWFIYLIAQGFRHEPDKLPLAIYYSRIAFPYLFFMGVGSVFGALLNANNRFFATAFAPILLNLVLLLALWGAHIRGGFVLDWLLWAVLLAGAAQAFWLAVAAYQAGWLVRPRPATTNAARGERRQFFRLFVPGVLAASVGQINLLVGTSIASAQKGAAAWLYYADRLYQLPLGVIGVGVGVALLPALARNLATDTPAQARMTQRNAIGLAMFFTFPACLGLYLLSLPMMQILFERGAFSATDSAAAALALRAFVWGLPAFVLIKLVQPIFFAHKDTISPMRDGAIGVAVNIALALLLFERYGHVAIAAATSLAGWVTFLLMARRAWRLGYWKPALSGAVLRYLAAVIAGLGAMWLFVSLYLDVLRMPSAVSSQALWLSGVVAGGALIYISFSLGLLERSFTRRLWQNRRRNRS